MKKNILLLLSVVFIFSITQAQQNKKYTVQFDSASKQFILVGETQIEDLEILDKVSGDTTIKVSKGKWFSNKLPNIKIYDSLQSLKRYRLLLFYGTWCPDSKMLIPQYLYMLKKVDSTFKNLTLYALDRAKDKNDKIAYSLGVTRVPTLLIYDQAGKEQFRIVEFGEEGWQNDLQSFLLKK